jgi:hypothetical protein
MLKAYGRGQKPNETLKATMDHIIANRASKPAGIITSNMGSSQTQMYIDMFRDYYRHLGIDLDDYFDADLAKILDN